MGSIPEPTLNHSPANGASTTATTTKRSAPTVYSRDFAYADNGPIVVVPTRIARADILKASAKAYAEYVAHTPAILSPAHRNEWFQLLGSLCPIAPSRTGWQIAQLPGFCER